MTALTVFDALADANRRRILERLASGPASVQEVGAGLGVGMSAVSQHLKVLREAGLVTYNAKGRRRIYRAACGAFDLIANRAEFMRRRELVNAEPGEDELEVLARERARNWPQLDPLNVLISFRVERLVHAMDKDIKRIAANAGLTAGEMLALGAIAALGPPYETSPTELKQALWISLPGIGKRLDRLEARGLVERLPNPADRRGRKVRLTTRGRSALEATHLGLGNPSYVALTRMPRERRIELEHLLRHWQHETGRIKESIGTNTDGLARQLR